MDDSLDRIPGIDYRDKIIDKNKCLDDSIGGFFELYMDNDNQRELLCGNIEIYKAELNQYTRMPKLLMKDDTL